MKSTRITTGFYIQLVIVMVAGFVLHEFAHWAMGKALGYPMQMSLNQAGPVGVVPGSGHKVLIDAAGPMLTLLLALVGFMLVIVRGQLFGWLWVFSALMMRALAAAVGVIMPNDEARISQHLGLGTWTLPVIVVAILLVLTIAASRRLRLGWKTHAAAYLVCSAALAAVVMSDQLLVRNLLGNP